MAYEVDFTNVSDGGPPLILTVVDALAGLRANEARYFKNKVTTTSSRSSGQKMPRMRSTTWRTF